MKGWKKSKLLKRKAKAATAEGGDWAEDFEMAAQAKRTCWILNIFWFWVIMLAIFIYFLLKN